MCSFSMEDFDAKGHEQWPGFMLTRRYSFWFRSSTRGWLVCLFFNHGMSRRIGRLASLVRFVVSARLWTFDVSFELSKF